AEARLSAEQRYADASARRDAAASEVAAVSDELTALESEVDGLTATLEENERALSESGATPAGPRAVTEPQVDQDATRDAAVRALGSRARGRPVDRHPRGARPRTLRVRRDAGRAPGCHRAAGRSGRDPRCGRPGPGRRPAVRASGRRHRVRVADTPRSGDRPT